MPSFNLPNICKIKSISEKIICKAVQKLRLHWNMWDIDSWRNFVRRRSLKSEMATNFEYFLLMMRTY